MSKGLKDSDVKDASNRLEDVSCLIARGVKHDLGNTNWRTPNELVVASDGGLKHRGSGVGADLNRGPQLVVERVLDVEYELASIRVSDAHLRDLSDQNLIDLKSLDLFHCVMMARYNGGVSDLNSKGEMVATPALDVKRFHEVVLILQECNDRGCIVVPVASI